MRAAVCMALVPRGAGEQKATATIVTPKTVITGAHRTCVQCHSASGDFIPEIQTGVLAITAAAVSAATRELKYCSRQVAAGKGGRMPNSRGVHIILEKL